MQIITNCQLFSDAPGPSQLRYSPDDGAIRMENVVRRLAPDRDIPEIITDAGLIQCVRITAQRWCAEQLILVLINEQNRRGWGGNERAAIVRAGIAGFIRRNNIKIIGA